MILTKQCSDCGKELPLDAFNSQKKTKDGKKYRCRECDRAYNRKRYKGNSDKITRRALEWQKKNVEKLKGYRSKWSSSPAGKARKALYRTLERTLFSEVDADKGLGCLKSEFKKYLESMWEDGMTWENYGRVWKVDYIAPAESFNLDTQEGLGAINNYTNLRPIYRKTANPNEK